MARKRWSGLSPTTRRVIVVGASFETALKAAALIDLSRRPAHALRGSKSRWAAAIVLINSAGLVPILYFTQGRRPA